MHFIVLISIAFEIIHSLIHSGRQSDHRLIILLPICPKITTAVTASYQNSEYYAETLPLKLK